MQKRASKTSQLDARIAELQEKLQATTELEEKESCTKQHALIVAKRHKYLSSQQMQDQYIARIALTLESSSLTAFLGGFFMPFLTKSDEYLHNTTA